MIRLTCVLLCAVLLISAACAQDSAAVRPLILEHLKRYPKMDAQDLYKLLYHAAMGNEHLMTDAVSIRKYLSREMASISASSAEPLIEILTPDSSVIRLNLRPYKAKGGDPQKLVEAMLRTAVHFRKDTNRLRAYWAAAEALAAEHAFPFTPEQLKTHFSEMEALGFPAVHHSKVFEDAYHPAYRLLLRTYIPR